MRTEPIGKITSVAPNADFSDPTRGSLDGPDEDYSIEISMGECDTIECITPQVRGGDASVERVATILAALNLRAPGSGTGEFFDQNSAYSSLAEFNDYVRQVLVS